MNVDKCNYIIFGSSRLKPEYFQFTFKEKLIPYSNNPIFLGVTLDENLNFVAHFENLRSRALKRLNVIKIFSHKSWKLSKWTLKSLYRSLVDSIFEYSFFCIANVSTQSLSRAQTIQNRAIRCIYKLPWDSPSS